VSPVSSSVPSGLLSNLERASRLQEASRLLAVQSAALRETAQLLRSECTDLRREHQVWSKVLLDLHEAQEPVLALCMKCRRLRTDGAWIPLPHGFDEQLSARGTLLVSHTYCEECLTAVWEGVSAPS
jgi:hypothetical protein